MPATQLETGRSSNTVSRDLVTGRVDIVAERGGGLGRIDDHGLGAGRRNSHERMSITDDDPLSAETAMVFENRIGRGDFQVRIEARTRLRATKETFVLTADLDVWEGDERIMAKSWNCPIPRDHI